MILTLPSRHNGNWMGAAFGIAEAGGMFGADVVSFAASNPTALVDGYILDERQVLLDVSQD